jgi:uncharacterized protein
MKKRNKTAKIVMLVFLCMVFLGCIGCTVVALEAYALVFSRLEDVQDNEFTTRIAWKEIDQVKYPREEVHFISDGNKLQGFIYGGSNNNGLIVISNGIGSTSDDYLPIVMYFVDKGWRVFCFNNTGVGGSEGESKRGLTQSVIDLDVALTFIKNSGRFNGLPVMLVGHSLGGFAVCAVLNLNQKPNAVVSFAGFNSSKEISEEQGVAMVGNAFYLFTPQTWAIEKQLFGEKAKLTAVDGINKAAIPVMIVHSSDDEIISAKRSSIYAHGSQINNPNVKIVFFDGENASGHDRVYGSKKATEYMKLATKSWEAYIAEHGYVSKATLAQWAEEYNFDKTIANELNMELMEMVNDLFNGAK